MLEADRLLGADPRREDEVVDGATSRGNGPEVEDEGGGA